MTQSSRRRVHISMPRDDLELLDRGAKAEGLSRSAFIEKLVQWKTAGYPREFWRNADDAKE